MKRYFITGLIFLLPFVITIFILGEVLDLITDPFISLAEYLLGKWAQTHPALPLITYRILVLISLCLFTLILGLFAQKFLVAHVLHLMQTWLQKIPVIRVIYRFSQDIAKIALSSDDKLFTQTVLVPFPHENSLAVGLISRPPPSNITSSGDGDIEIAVFIPTAPHPISGFLLLTSQKWVKSIDMSTEDAFKYIISCGTVNEIKKPPQTDTHG